MATLLQLAHVCVSRKLERLAPLVGFYNEAVALADCGTPLREAMFLAQVAEESGEFRCTEENLLYSAETLVRVWPHRFPTIESAAPYAHRPESLANLVYADRMGNGDAASGDGWKFRGRGWLQCTGRSAYQHLATALHLPLLDNPDLLALPENAGKSAAYFWRSHGLGALADQGDVAGCTRIINGGSTGLAARTAYYLRAVEALVPDTVVISGKKVA